MGVYLWLGLLKSPCVNGNLTQFLTQASKISPNFSPRPVKSNLSQSRSRLKISNQVVGDEGVGQVMMVGIWWSPC